VAEIGERCYRPEGDIPLALPLDRFAQHAVVAGWQCERVISNRLPPFLVGHGPGDCARRSVPEAIKPLDPYW